jgi:hypothetical protein
MNVKRFLGLALLTYLVCAAFAVVNQKDTPPKTYVETPVTITLGDLTPQQLQERAVELTTSTSTTTSTQPTTKVAYVDPATKCQEWSITPPLKQAHAVGNHGKCASKCSMLTDPTGNNLQLVKALTPAYFFLVAPSNLPPLEPQ